MNRYNKEKGTKGGVRQGQNRQQVEYCSIFLLTACISEKKKKCVIIWSYIHRYVQTGMNILKV